LADLLCVYELIIEMKFPNINLLKAV